MHDYRITMTVTRVGEYLFEGRFANDQEAEEYAQSLTPDDMIETDDYTLDMRVETARAD